MPQTDPTSNVTTDQLTRALGEAVIRIWSNLPQEVQDHLFREAVASQGETIRSHLAVFLHDRHISKLRDPLGDPRETNRTGQPWRLARLSPRWRRWPGLSRSRKWRGFIAYACPSCQFTFGKILPAHGSRGEE